MQTLSFPQTQYFEHLQNTVKEFDFNAMLLSAINRYCYQLIIYEIFGMEFNFHQSYKYYFSDFEIADLGKRHPKDIVKNKQIEVPFDFNLSVFHKQYKGTVKISCTFINKETLENSFYEIDIELLPETDFHIQPFFLTDAAFKSHIAEFMQKLWTNVLLTLLNIKVPKSIKTNNYARISELFMCKTTENKNLDDLTKDVYLIAYTIIKKNNGLKLISADDILNARCLKKNKNSLGVTSGFKKHEREKIHIALKELNYRGYLSVFETEPYNYIINLPPSQRQQSYLTMPVKLCRYHYKNELWQKRIGLFLCIYKPQKIKVKTLFLQVKELCPSYKPVQIRDKFEETMDNLISDQIIKSWFYEKINEDQMQGKNWFKKWENLNIICRY